MNTYLDQIGRQEFTKQHSEQIYQASALASVARRPGNPNLTSLISSKLTVRSKSWLAQPWFNRSFAFLVQSLRG